MSLSALTAMLLSSLFAKAFEQILESPHLSVQQYLLLR